MEAVSEIARERWVELTIPPLPPTTKDILKQICDLRGTDFVWVSADLSQRVNTIQETMKHLEVEKKEGTHRNRNRCIGAWLTSALAVAITAALILGAIYSTPLLITAAVLYVVMLCVGAMCVGGSEGAFYVMTLWPVVLPIFAFRQPDTQQVQKRLNAQIDQEVAQVEPILLQAKTFLDRFEKQMQTDLVEKQNAQEQIRERNQRTLYDAGALESVENTIVQYKTIRDAMQQLHEQLNVMFSE